MKFSLGLIILPVFFASVVRAEEKTLEFKNLKGALVSLRKSDNEKAIELLKQMVQDPKAPQDYVRFYLGKAYFNLGKHAEAETEIKKVLELNPNSKMSIESSYLLSQIALKANNFKDAKARLQILERRTRNTEDYPDVIYSLALVEKGLEQTRNMCNWLVRLYEKYPDYPPVEKWGYDLTKNEFEGKPTGCVSDQENFKTRVRYLLWAGLDKKAQAEIDLLKKEVVKTDKFAADRFQAQFYVQEGEVVKALELLKPHYDSKKKDVDFLLLFATAAARSGESQLAIGSYYSIYKSTPSSKTGRNALYQSAFLSYQFQDYDGAARRFNEFIKLNRKSGLVKDAQWHLAWLKYLKADFSGAYSDFKKLSDAKRRSPRQWRSFPQDRLDYWMAMSLFRQGKLAESKAIFAGLAKDPLMGYYSIAANARLKKLEATPLVPLKVAETNLPVHPRLITRFYASEYLIPETSGYVTADLTAEGEETLVMSQYAMMDEMVDEEEAELGGDNPDAKSMEVAEAPVEEAPLVSGDPATIFQTKSLLNQFLRAKNLIEIGENDWARWDLYDIERKTSNKTYLKVLMDEYYNAEQFNRAAYIAQINFGAHRAKQGLEKGRKLWETAYPRAYNQYVDIYSSKFKVPEELIWGIMRAETNYKKDAISPVGALGLMQVMPVTGYRVAEILNEKNFTPKKLLQPETAVKIGSRYLKRLMDRFENAIPFVAAGYNAGPHRVKSWVSNFGNLETDEFIEHIPFLETRNYVKRVVSNAHIYAQIYGKNKELYPYLAGPLPVKFNSSVVGKENWDDI